MAGSHRAAPVGGDVDGHDVAESDGHGQLTRTYGEFFAGLVRVLVFFGGVGVVFSGLVRFVVNGLGNKWGLSLPHISGGVCIACGAVLGLVAVAVYVGLMRPRRSVDRVGDRDGTAQVGGRLWVVPRPDDADGGRRGPGADGLTP